MLSRASANPFRRSDYVKWFIGDSFVAFSSGLTLVSTLALIGVGADAGVTGAILSCIAGVGLLMTLVGGAFADTHARRRIILLTAAVAALANGVLAVMLLLYSVGDLAAIGAGSWAMIAVVGGCGALGAWATAFANPAVDAALKQIITPEEFPTALSSATARAHVFGVVGGPLAVWLMSASLAIGPLVRLGAETLFLASFARIRADLGPARSVARGSRDLVKNMSAGVRFVWSQRTLRPIVIAAPLVNLLLFGGMQWGMIYLVGAGRNWEAGILAAAFAAGGFAGSVVAPRVVSRVGSGVVAIAGISVMTVAMTVFFVGHSSMPVLVACAFASMLPSASVNGSIFGYVFAATPSRLQGRVQAAFSVIAGISAASAPLMAGLAISANAVGVLAVVCAGAGVVGAGVLVQSAPVRRLPVPKAWPRVAESGDEDELST